MRQVTGEFPPQREGGIIPRPWLQACAHPEDVERHGNTFWHLPKVPSMFGRQFPRVQLGVDVAGGGGDLTVIRERRGLVLGREWTIDSDDSERIVDLVVECAETVGASLVVVDSIGVGFGVLGSVRRRLQTVRETDTGKTVDVRVEGFNAAEKPDPSPDPTWPAFENKRSQLWWQGRELSRLKVWDTTLLFWDPLGNPLRDDLTADDLTGVLWEERKGKVIVEPKDDVRDSLGRSPDHAEAALLAFWLPARLRARIAAVPNATRAGFSPLAPRP
jgi:hypothetical protein